MSTNDPIAKLREDLKALPRFDDYDQGRVMDFVGTNADLAKHFSDFIANSRALEAAAVQAYRGTGIGKIGLGRSDNSREEQQWVNKTLADPKKALLDSIIAINLTLIPRDDDAALTDEKLQAELAIRRPLNAIQNKLMQATGLRDGLNPVQSRGY